ncbi:MAG: Rpp14/Pop5 family protein [Candidatus Aenigmatarchaeota archaeon]
MAEEIKFARPAMLPPTLRPRARYLAYEVISDTKVEFTEVINTIWFSVIGLLGELGAAETHLRVIKDSWNPEKQIGLLRVSHTTVEPVRAALALASRIGDTPVIIRVLGVSGTIKGARKKFFGEVDLESFA